MKGTVALGVACILGRSRVLNLELIMELGRQIAKDLNRVTRIVILDRFGAHCSMLSPTGLRIR
jgi:hypothetical protein